MQQGLFCTVDACHFPEKKSAEEFFSKKSLVEIG
jgi:hypothetical protein